MSVYFMLKLIVVKPRGVLRRRFWGFKPPPPLKLYKIVSYLCRVLVPVIELLKL